MYIPPHFAQAQPEELHRIIRAHPLGTIVRAGAGGLDADHVPFEFDPAAGPLGKLSAHVARANPLWERCPTGTEVLVIFRGAEAYVSPNWYPSKHEAHRQVPTWNYQAVHVHGELTVHDDERFVRGVVARLTRTHEAGTGAPRPWKMGDSSADYIDDMLGRIVGLEVTVTRMIGKWKLGQNKDARDREGAIAALREGGHDAMAAAMAATLEGPR